MRAFALRNFVFVVRELQVHAAGMDVQGFTEVGADHGRAFDMPARATAAPGRIPAGQVASGGFPQDEITRVTLVGCDFHASACQHFFRITARELAVVLERVDREQGMAFGRIGMAVVDQALDHGDDLRDMCGGLRFDVRRRHAQAGHVGAVGGGVLVGDH